MSTRFVLAILVGNALLLAVVVIAVALGTVFLNEAIGWSTVAAGAAIVVAVVLIVTARTPKTQVVGEVPEPLKAAA